MKKTFYIFAITLLLPVLGYAQKAYKAFTYQADFDQIHVNFILTDGYPVGSTLFGVNKIDHRKLQFTADGDVSENGQLKLSAINVANKKFDDYFIIDGIQSSFARIPAKLNARYYAKGKTYSLILSRY